jgi:hypothetical protein
VFERVSTALLQAYFGDPEMLEETYYDEVQAAHMRHALELERIRLRRLAQTEARRLRQEAGTCAACGKSLPTFFPHLSFPPHYCSRDCAPAERTATRAAADWGTP